MFKLHCFRIPIALTGIALALLLQVGVSQPAFAQEVHRFNIDTTDAAVAIHLFGAQSGVQILASADVLDGKHLNNLSGELSTDEGFERLLAGSGLEHRYVGQRAVALVAKNSATSSDLQTPQSGQKDSDDATRASATTEKAEPAQNSAQEGATIVAPQGKEISRATGERSDRSTLDEVVVTGTHIRGVKNVTAPIIVLDRDYIDSTGAATTVALIESLPQNFALASPSGVLVPGVSSPEVQGSAINLRAIGEGTTLTLLNGRRMAPGFFGRAPDIAALPLSAVERVEVLTDGASAIYGSDAVGGVVNFILRRDFTGAETRLMGGWADDVNEYRLSQALGNAWDSGNALLSLEYFKRDLLRTEDRSFIPPETQIGSLYPRDENYSVLFSGRQELMNTLSAFADGLYTNRDTYNEGGRSIFNLSSETENPQLTATGGLNYKWGDWQIEGSASYAENKTDLIGRSTEPGVPSPLIFDSKFTIESAQLKADGPLFDLPGGALRAAIGADWRSEFYSFANSFGLAGDFDRIVRSAFGEVDVPIIGPDNSRSGAKRLELSLAGRFDDYSSFGSSFDPKVGLMWEPTAGLQFRGSWGTSYVAPSLTDYDVSLNGASAFTFADPGSASGNSYQLLISGNHAEDLSAQESKSWSLGLDWSPVSVSSLRVGLNYYRIDYTDRIATPPNFIFILDNPASFGELITRNPTIEEVNAAIASGEDGFGFFPFDPEDPNFTPIPVEDFDPSDVDVIVDTRRQNLSVVNTDGLDVSLQYAFEVAGGHIQLGLGGTFILKLEQQLTATSEPFEVVDTFNNPPDWRIRGSLGWQRHGWSANLFVNHTDSYVDNRIADEPVPIGSYTTADAQVAYDFSGRAQSGFLKGVSIAASAQNLLDQDPPRTAVLFDFSDLGFDPTNANPMGRLFALEFVKTW